MSQMTRIEPLDFRPPMPPYSGPADAVQVEMIGIDRLRIDHDYQRGLSEKSRRTIGQIARDFSWARFGVLTVAQTGQTYAVIDGQHRAIAAASIGISKLPCLVFQAGKADQARDFVGINSTRTKITPVDTFRAACVAGDPQAVELREILDHLGIALTNMPLSKQRGRETRAISTLLRILAKRGRGQGQPCIAFDCKGSEVQVMTDQSHPTLRSMGSAQSHPNAGGHAAVAFDMRGRKGGAQFEGPHDTANIRAASGGSSRSYIAHPWVVRRLTPRECERLQGFPDDHTLIPRDRKRALRDLNDELTYLRSEYPDLSEEEALRLAADGPRYKALGNSMAVPVVRWILERIRTSRENYWQRT